MEILPTFNIDLGEPYTRTITISDSNGPIDFTDWSATAIIFDTNTGDEMAETTPTLDDEGNVIVTFSDTLTNFVPENSGVGFSGLNLLKPTYQYMCEIKLINPDGELSRLMRARVKVTG